MAQQIQSGSKVSFKGQNGIVDSYSKGWYAVKMEDGNMAKARAKSLMEFQESYPGIDDKQESFIEIHDEQEAAEAGIIDMVCVECGHEWKIDPESQKHVNVQCPSCGAWNRVRLNPNRERYSRGLGTTAGGNSTLDIADHVADALRGLNRDAIYWTAARDIVSFIENYGPEVLSKRMKKDGIDEHSTVEGIANYLAAKYAKRNDGMARMNVGNTLRNIWKRAAELDID